MKELTREFYQALINDSWSETYNFIEKHGEREDLSEGFTNIVITLKIPRIELAWRDRLEISMYIKHITINAELLIQKKTEAVEIYGYNRYKERILLEYLHLGIIGILQYNLIEI